MTSPAPILVVLALAAVLAPPLAPPLAAAPLSENAARGRTLAVWRCGGCHAIETGEGGAVGAPSFLDLARRYDAAGIERRLTGAAHRRVEMPPKDLTTDEALVISAYIASLRPVSRPSRP